MTDNAAQQQPTGRNARLGEILIQARVSKGLELSDIAEVTHVRKEYLQALEEGRYQDLPEDVYAKNFLRLYTQAVGLDEGRALALFNQEKHLIPESAQASARHPTLDEKKPRRRPRGLDIGGLLPTLLLIAIIILLALWGFNRTLFRSTNVNTTAPVAAPAPPPSTPNTTGSSAEGAAAKLVHLSLVSTPAGAQVSIDGYALAGATPLTDAPVTAGKERVIKVSLPGYKTETFSADLSSDAHLSVALTPAPPPATPQSALQGAAPTVAASQGALVLNITAPSWLEVYKGTARGEGQPLVYRTAQAGETFKFSLPVYVHVGNAGGVSVLLNGQDKGLLGSSGEVVSRVFTK